MGRHAVENSDGELTPSPWIAGLITGAMATLVFVTAFVVLLRTWIG